MITFIITFYLKNVFVNDISTLTPKTIIMTLSSQAYCYKQKVQFQFRHISTKNPKF